MKLGKRGQVGGGIIGAFAAIIGVSFVLLIAGIFMAYQADIVTDIQSDFVTDTAACNSTDTSGCGYAYNVTQDNLAATNDLAEKQGTLTNIAIAVVIIAMLLIAAGIVGIRIAAG